MAKGKAFAVNREQALQAAEEMRALFENGDAQTIWAEEMKRVFKSSDGIMDETFWKMVVGWSLLQAETVREEACAYDAFMGVVFSPDGEGIGINVQARTPKATISFSELYSNVAIDLTGSLMRLAGEKPKVGFGITTMEYIPPKDKQN